MPGHAAGLPAAAIRPPGLTSSLPVEAVRLPAMANGLPVDVIRMAGRRFYATGGAGFRLGGKGNDEPRAAGQAVEAFHPSNEEKTVMSSTKKKTVPVQAAPVSPAPASPAPTIAPDPNAALEAAVADAVSQIAALQTTVGVDPVITPAQKQRATKMRKGGEPIAATLGALAQQHQIESPALQVAPMTAALGKAAALQPLVTAVASFSKRLDDMVFEAQSGAWATALQLYAVLRRMAATDSALSTALGPVTAFMSYRHATPKAPGQPTKRQERSIKKSVKNVKKLAPQLLVEPQQEPSAPAAPTTPPPPAPPAPGSPQHS
jgi:hypothetical protein